jgi:hypothetical protein
MHQFFLYHGIAVFEDILKRSQASAFVGGVPVDTTEEREKVIRGFVQEFWPADDGEIIDRLVARAKDILLKEVSSPGFTDNYLLMQYTNLPDPILLVRQEGGTAKTWTLQPEEGEQEATVTVTATVLINKLTVTANKGTTTPWPLTPHEAPQQLPWSPAPGSSFAGFAVTFNASGGDYCLKTLTPVAVTFQPATWMGAGADKA